ncbi:MAG: M24 family metallopeptidase, partial [Gammaproteobacteria bacterium]|nr:M24 family metallopeptidase [Gammaproteobacteria bacterium]
MSNTEPQFEKQINEVEIERQQRLRETMRKLNSPVMLILDSINIKYATGASNMTIFSTRTPARYLLIFAEGPAILYEYFGCGHLARSRSTIDDVRAGRGLCYVSSGGDPESQARAMAREIAAAVEDAGFRIDSLAIDRFPYPCIDALRAEGFSISDADSILSAARKIKLPGEILLLREALNRVVEAASEMEAHIEPGRRETEIWADFSRPFIASGGEYVSTRLFQSGPRTYPYFQEAGSRKTEAGDLICFDTDTIGFAGYCTDFSRTYLCGNASASPEQKGLYLKAKDQLDHNVELIKSGVTFQEIAESAWPIPGGYQASRYYCIGHGLGMSGEYPNIPHAITGEPYPLDGV